jgi:MFS family permease
MRLVLPARAVSFFGDSLAFVVLSLHIAQSDRPALMTLMFIAFSLPLFAMSPIAGRIIDEHDSRRLLVAAGSLQALASAGLVWGPNMGAILGFVLLLQVGQAITAPTWGAVVPRIVGEELVGKAVGMQQSLSSMAGLAGAAVGGVLFDVLGYHLTMMLDTSTFALLVVTGAVVRTRRGRRYDVLSGLGDHTARDRDQSTSGMAYIFSDSLLRLLVPALWIFILAIEAANVVEVFLVTGDLGASASVYGVAMACVMLGQIIGPILAGRVGADLRRVLWTGVSAALLGVVVTGIGLSVTVWMTLPMFVVCGTCGGALNALINTIVVTRPPEHLRGRVLSTLNGTARGFSVLAMVLGGLTGQLVGARSTFVICGLLSVAAAGLVFRCRRGVEAPQATSKEPALQAV